MMEQEQKKEMLTAIRPEAVTAEDARLRAMHILQILREETDEEHPLSTNELKQMMLERYGTKMHRTKIPDDISALMAGGHEIRLRRSRACSYYYDGWKFDLAELKVLIDAVQSSKFISEKKSRALIEKLASMTGRRNAEGLRRSLAVSGRVKNDDENICGVVDALHQAINAKKKVSFLYFAYNGRKQKELKNGGAPYTVSPYDLIWDGDFYYLLGWCDERAAMRTFRVDRIYEVPEILEAPAAKKPKGYRVSKYTNDSFRMFVSQEPVTITMLCQGYMMGAVIDKFGRNAKTADNKDGTFTLIAPVCVSPAFYNWVFGSGGGVRIIGPDEVREEYICRIRREMEAVGL